METRNFGKLLYGIDWEDKGWVSFGQETYNPFNILSKNRFFDTLYGSSTNGNLTAKSSVTPKGLYGLEVVDIDFHEDSGFYTLGFNTVTGTNQFPVSPSQDYTFWVWISSENDYTNDGTHVFTLSIQEFDVSEVLVTSNDVATDLDGNNEVAPYYITFTTDVATDHISFLISKVDTDYSALKITVHGILMYDFTGVVQPTWGTGESVPGTIIDNDITPFVLAAQGSIGKTNWETILFDEGQLSLTLNNESKNFSPEFVDGDYYTYLRPYRRVWVSASDEDGIYRLLWSGWTHQFSLQTGIKGTRQATITARQGKYNIEAQDADDLVAVADKPSVLLLLDLFSGGYVVPSQSEDSTVTRDIIIKAFDDDGVTVPIFGTDFVEDGNNKRYLDELEHISELNGNYVFLTREGKIIFKTFQSVKDTLPEALPYGLTTSVNYIYAPVDLYKEIVVNYTHYANADDIEMQGQDVVLASGSTDFPFSVYPEYNGKPLIGAVVLDVSSFLPTDYNTTPSMGTANAAFTEIDEGIYTWYTGLANDTTDLDYRLSLISRDSGSVWYAQDINQKYVAVGIENVALTTLSYSNPLITTEDMAVDFANMQIDRRASVLGWFDKADLTNKTAESITWILNHSVGDVVYLQEEQSGNIPKHLIIIGESFNYTPGYFQMHYNLAPSGAEVDVAGFTYVVNGQHVDFDNQSVVSDTPTWAWEFGD